MPTFKLILFPDRFRRCKLCVTSGLRQADCKIKYLYSLTAPRHLGLDNDKNRAWLTHSWLFILWDDGGTDRGILKLSQLDKVRGYWLGIVLWNYWLNSSVILEFRVSFLCLHKKEKCSDFAFKMGPLLNPEFEAAQKQLVIFWSVRV